MLWFRILTKILVKLCSQAVPAEFYFKCTNGNQDHLAPPLYQIRANINSIPCLACTESLDTVLVFECEDRHVICLQCFGIYAKGRLNERQMIADPDLGMEISTDTGFDCYLYNINSLYICCLQDRRIISFSVVNITEKLRCFQLGLGHFFWHDWKELFKNKTKLGNNFQHEISFIWRNHK